MIGVLPDGGPLISDEGCELDAGVCANAFRVCVEFSDGGWGWETPCTARSYGPNYEPSESRCDGLDNDCDGRVDNLRGTSNPLVELTQPCQLTQGVCANSHPVCVDGGYENPCGAASYGPNWQPYETKCDGLDNDCDGLVDTWTAINASMTGATPGASRVALVAIPDAGAGMGVILMWSANNKILSRAVVGGVLGPIQSPSASLQTALSGGDEVIDSDGTTLAAAWTETYMQGPNTLERLMVATIGSSGVSNLSNGGAQQLNNLFFSNQPGTIKALHIALGSGHVILGIGAGYGDAGVPSIEVLAIPLPLPQTPDLNMFVAGGPTLDAGNVFSLAYLDAGTIGLAWQVNGLSSSVAANVYFDGGLVISAPLAGATDPLLLPGSAGQAMYSGHSDGGFPVIGVANWNPSNALFSAAPDFSPTLPSPVSHGLDPISTPRAIPTGFTWDDSSSVWYYASGMLAPATVTGPGAYGERPKAALPGPGPKNMSIAYDSYDGGTGDAFLQPICLP